MLPTLIIIVNYAQVAFATKHRPLWRVARYSWAFVVCVAHYTKQATHYIYYTSQSVTIFAKF